MHTIEEQENKIVIRVDTGEGPHHEGDIRVELVGTSRRRLVISRLATSTAASPRPTAPEEQESASTDCDATDDENQRPPQKTAVSNSAETTDDESDAQAAVPLCLPIVLPRNLNLDTISITDAKDTITIEIQRKTYLEEQAMAVRSITKEELTNFRHLARLEQKAERKRKHFSDLCEMAQVGRMAMREAELRVVKAKMQNHKDSESARVTIDLKGGFDKLSKQETEREKKATVSDDAKAEV
mmetsp:Transcript_40635/g.95497  ORF Transcript_40635/g.95497 Transcript_40635/m.95497 type:complete len:241 (-) Transcript_40635:61-783(-)